MTVNERLRVSVPSDSRTRPPHLEHPRLRRRRVGVRRAAGRRRLRVLVALASSLTLAAAVWGVARSPLLDVDRVSVVGAERTGTAAVLAAARIGSAEAMGDVDEAAAARRIERLPWVRRAVVRREWPGTVRVAVVERRAVAVTRTFEDQWALLDGGGRVLAWVPERPVELPWVAGEVPAGPPASRVDPAVASLLPVAKAMPPGLGQRTGAIVAMASEVELFLLPQGLVRLGTPATAVQRLPVAEAVLARVVPGERVVIDTRFPSTAVLTRA